MKKTKTKRVLYLRIFSSFLATYLVLMIGFSVFLISQQKKVEEMELRTYALQVNNNVENILKDYMDNNNQITDISKVKREFAANLPLYTLEGTEMAVFTGDYQLLFNTNDYWRISYTEYKDGNKYYTGYGLLNPKDWFSDKEIKELEGYLLAAPKVEKAGDLSGYSVDIKGFWVDNEMIIPDKVTVNALYAQTLDEKGNVISSSGTQTDDIVYLSNYKNSAGLPHFEYGTILPEQNGNPNDEKQNELRQMVTNQEKLKDALPQLMGAKIFSQRMNLLNYRYYWPQPYQSTIYAKDDQGSYSHFWMVVGRDVNLWEQCFPTLAFIWISCLLTFIIAALILSRQTYKTYKKREDLERQRKEVTNALAHDLKTPLSIISGYAQNLHENIHTEKREHYVAHIQSNIDRMDKIIRQMLGLSRLESDSLEVKFDKVSLKEMCNEVIIRYKQVCDEKSITTCLEGDAVVMADRSLIGRVIDNFFINAIDHMPEGGKICIGISDNTLEVYNSGSHILKEKIEEIWLPFKKGDISRSNTKGTGLGLAISRSILELHKFPYGAKNSEDGVIFWFKFK
ncbi:sensor histidine kinase [Schinkia azotoformans]|uniref:sensor histidine kinase n=1 Tax=Schinkia azotoformans TaxID=1454 RepID=UPI002DC014B4|nr:HAMP domain-containing sensor histidine kinase [Schinkia azotoformans]MEC1717370.1 HAMP domain-containing sensor histidine kinase [Schinkia azotoformans]MEC1741629.1 HAMP domain-containing sensor histidine kinase [Schinkia azotoformans]MEC1745651.1 HAMP domain-containing sensor histidine kinase [Schinkia azotoformans]MEC1758979.1 HAMP domain-containing sensor histidine kinase [Schinkia azotoformans]MEC1766849.1 HAMP domain-containing sensor histidine kinase [Schinkia azotoformans]